MNKHFVATTALALVLSHTSIFVIVALCPHLGSKAVSCDLQAASAESSHHEMDHSQMMVSGPLSTETKDSTAAALTEPIGSCKHCALHSRTSPNTGSPGEWSIPQRSGDLTLALPLAKFTPVRTLPPAVVGTKAHGPPGNEIPRHVLLSTFRI